MVFRLTAVSVLLTLSLMSDLKTYKIKNSVTYNFMLIGDKFCKGGSGRPDFFTTGGDAARNRVICTVFYGIHRGRGCQTSQCCRVNNGSWVCLLFNCLFIYLRRIYSLKPYPGREKWGRKAQMLDFVYKGLFFKQEPAQLWGFRR